MITDSGSVASDPRYRANEWDQTTSTAMHMRIRSKLLDSRVAVAGGTRNLRFDAIVNHSTPNPGVSPRRYISKKPMIL